MSREKNPWFHFGLAIGANIQDNQLALPHEWHEELRTPVAHKPPSARKPLVTPAHRQREHDKRLHAV